VELKIIEELSYVICFNETAIKHSINPIVLIVQLAGTPFRMIPQILCTLHARARGGFVMNIFVYPMN